MERHMGRFDFLSYSETTETPPRMVNDIVKAVRNAYTVVGKSLGIVPENVYASSHCFDVCNAMVPRLSSYRIKPVTVTYLFVPHHYLILYVPLSQKPIIADPTWQGMLSRSDRTIEKPKILVGTSGEVVGELQSHGLTQEQTIPWTFK
jgi:hypothetical protein